MSKCPKCKQKSCGIDTHTRTKFKTERNVGDRLKLILLSVYDMVEIDNLQTPEIKALISNLIDEHIDETDE
jgi:hypothetical protein